MMSYTVSRQPEHFDLKRMFALTQELGLAGIDMVTLHDTPAGELRKMADDHGVPVVCHTFNVDLNMPDSAGRSGAIDECKRGIEAAVTLGAPIIMLPTPRKKGVDHRTSHRNWIAGLCEVAPLAEDAGLTLTVEHFTGVESPFVLAAELLEAVEKVPGMKITYDNGNAATGEDPVASFNACAEHVVHAHFKDWYISDTESDGSRQMRNGRFYTPALIGEGNMDHAACLTAMKAAGYDGCINIEYEGNEYDPYTGISKAIRYLRELEETL